MMLAPAAFFAALAIGLVALLLDQRSSTPRMAMTVAPIVITVPGIYAFEMIVWLNSGQILDALQASGTSLSLSPWRWAWQRRCVLVLRKGRSGAHDLRGCDPGGGGNLGGNAPGN
jgi:hypothetical protein